MNPAGGPASLLGSFAYPAKVEVNTEPLVWEFVKTIGTGRGEKIRKTIHCLSVPGEDHFFFVGTVAPGTHPTVNVTGSGLDAVVTVGKRTIRFDGTKLVLGTGR